MDLGIPASISNDYIPDLPTRLGIYQRLVLLDDLDAVREMEDELRDRFGEMPWQTKNLLYVLRLKLEAKRAEVWSIARDGGRVTLRLAGEVGGARNVLQRELGRGVEVGNTQIRLEFGSLAGGWEQPLIDAVRKLGDFMERMTAGVDTAAGG